MEKEAHSADGYIETEARYPETVLFWGRGSARRGSTLEDRLKELMQELGNAINESLSDSDRIAAAIGEIRQAGYDVFLVLEATIGFTRHEGSSGLTGKDLNSSDDLEITSQDVQFLRSLRITVNNGK